MLLWLLAETHGQESPSIPEIAEIVGVSERHVKRLVEQCEADGDIKVTRGRGRGHHSTYHVTYLLKGDTAPFQNATRANKDGKIKGDIKGDASPRIKGDIGARVSPFPTEIKGDIANPPHTPQKDILNINTNSPLTNVRGETHAPGGAASPAAEQKSAKKSSKEDGAVSKLSTEEREVVEIWRDVAKAYPPEYAWPTIFKRLLPGFDAERFRQCAGAYLAYYGKGQRQVGGICDWYDENLTKPRGGANGSNRQNNGAAGKPAKPSLAEQLEAYNDFYGVGGAAGAAGENPRR